MEKKIDIDKCSRDGFKNCYYESAGYGEFKGQVSKIKKGRYLFEKIDVSWEYGGIYYRSKEEHVWLFETKKLKAHNIKIGDNVSFTGIIKPYTRKNGTVDLGIEEIDNIKKIDNYELPTDQELHEQFMQDLKCELCLYTDHCDQVFCMMPESKQKVYIASPNFSEKTKKKIKQIKKLLKNSDYDVYIPDDSPMDNISNKEWSNIIFERNIRELCTSKFVVLLNYGSTMDANTSFVGGFACALGIPILNICMRNNINSLMLINSSYAQMYYDEFIQLENVKLEKITDIVEDEQR